MAGSNRIGWQLWAGFYKTVVKPDGRVFGTVKIDYLVGISKTSITIKGEGCNIRHYEIARRTRTSHNEIEWLCTNAEPTVDQPNLEYGVVSYHSVQCRVKLRTYDNGSTELTVYGSDREKVVYSLSEY